MAHELRNPLNTLDHSLALLSLVADDKPEITDLRGTMTRQIRQMTRLVEDLLDLTRISHGKVCLKTQPVNLNQVVAAAVEAVRPSIDAGHHELRVIKPDEPLVVNGDGVRLTQVFTNLLQNAAKFTASGGRIWLEVRHEREAAMVSVRDNGYGIESETLAQIFEPLWQASRTQERSSRRAGDRAVSRQATGHDARGHDRGRERGTRKGEPVRRWLAGHHHAGAGGHGRVGLLELMSSRTIGPDETEQMARRLHVKSAC